MNNRIEELDSIRGIAALSVIFGHYLNIFSSTIETKLIEYGPFRPLISGNEAVLLFFMLSGFVLSLPFLKGRKNNLSNYRDFAIKRIARIYLPYLVAIIIAIICNYFLYNGNVDHLSGWFNALWDSPITFEAIAQHLLFLGEYPKQFNVVTWSLVEELRISLIFPILMMLVLKFNWKANIGLVATLYLLSILIRIILGSSYDGISYTIYYSSIFVVGALIAKNKDEIVNYIKNLSNIKQTIFVITGLFLYAYAKPSFALNLFYNMENFYRGKIDFIFTITGVAMIVIMSISIKPISRFLLKNSIKFLGKISFSVYLYHLIILLSFIYIFDTMLPIWLILVVSFIFTILISTVSYYYVEEPAINFGKFLVSKINNKKDKREKVAV